jgi:cyclic beta-1,2-glucan synthetase
VIKSASDNQSQVVSKIVRIHQWWQRRGLSSDVVMLRTDASGYDEPLRQSLLMAMRESGLLEALGGAGGIHLQFADQIGLITRTLLESAAGVVLDGNRETLEEALQDRPEERDPARRLGATR